MRDIFGNSLNFIILVVVLVFIMISSVLLIQGYVSPLTKSMASEDNDTVGLSKSVYIEKAENMESALVWFFIILIVGVFLYFAVKLLYEKEETSAYTPYYGG